MADKKKMSVAEILAAARKTDGKGGESSADAPAAPAKEPSSPASAPAASAPSKPIPKPGSGARPSVAEMMAMARAQNSAESATSAPKPAAKAKASDKPAAEKGAAKPKPAAAAPAVARDTASILAAARKGDKAGPMTKAEAAAKAPASAGPKAPAKEAIVVPPMPVKPDYAKPKAAKAAAAPAGDGDTRRNFLGLGFWLLGGVSTLWTLLTVKFMFPNVLREPPSRFKVGFPDAYPAGQVQEKFKAQFAVWIVNTEYNGQPQIVALKSVCTHLGCTPNWLEAEQKFKCPCHGSGFYKDGINFEGPAPRPLERYAIRLADDGQIEVDKSRTFQEERGQWTDPACYIPA